MMLTTTTTPISFKTYILTKHQFHFRTCDKRNITPMEEESDENLRKDAPQESELPVMIADLSTDRNRNQSAMPSTSVPSFQSARTIEETSKTTRRTEIACTQCDKVFTHRGDLNKHLRTHSGEKPYVCPTPQCGKRFAHSSNLRRHIVVHSGDKPFNCDRCGRSFNRKDKLLLHQQTRLCRKRSQTATSSSSSSSNLHPTSH